MKPKDIGHAFDVAEQKLEQRRTGDVAAVWAQSCSCEG
jgi:hypothetical protein